MKRISGYISEELHEAICQMAAKEKRSVVYMIDILLQSAVKEKTRKRNAKKDSTKHNSANVGESYPTG